MTKQETQEGSFWTKDGIFEIKEELEETEKSSKSNKEIRDNDNIEYSKEIDEEEDFNV